MAQVARNRESEAVAEESSRAFAESSRLPTHFRAAVLAKIASGIEEQSEDFARLISLEVKKPLKEARREVARASFTFRWAAEEARRFSGEVLPLDLDQSSEGRLALTRRFPRGPALLITPFNFPLNLVAHKVAPAIAVGASFVLKPAPQAVRTAEKLIALVRRSGYPEKAAILADLPVSEAESLARDERFEILSFTGSAAVGWKLKTLAGRKHVVLELGGNSAVFVARDADLPWAAARSAWGAYYYSGQVCISVQNIFVEEPVYEDFKDLLLQNIRELKMGDPSQETTDIGPLISVEAAERVEDWIKEAVRNGGRLAAGGTRQGDAIAPTLVENPPAACRLKTEEAFGPVATIEAVDSRERAFEKISRGRYGLQVGIFTRDISAILGAWRSMRAGGIIVNDIPSYRSDAMPYGGTKESGIGREGVKYAMEEMTELRTLVLKP